MKLTKAQKAACAVVAQWGMSPMASATLAVPIAEAIEAAVKAERRACAKIADDQWADLTAKLIRARGRS